METQEIGIDAIERLGKIPKEIMKMLVISYMSLEDEYKKIFLFVACLLKGESKGNAIRKLESRGFHARNGLNVLEHRCLITLISSENGHVVLGVHDYIEEMAKNIVCREYLDEPNKHSGRWIGEKNEDMLANDKGTEATRSLNVNMSRGNSGIVIFYEYVREVSKASMFGLKKLQEQVLSNKRLLFSLGILITAYFYSMASSSNSSAPEIMVSTSNSSVENSFKYDVFLNFSGKDTRNAFLGHLYQDLQAKGIVTYKDDVDIEKGERINQLLKTIEESKLMVSTSNSSVENGFKYDVFLSFSGKDTRNAFLGHLYQALIDKGIVTYKDDVDIEKGERINDQLLKSIEESRFYIIVFSKNYASSSWCLDELVKIMECQKMTEHTAIPVFYDVDTTHVENQDGPVGEAFSKHKNHEAAGKWRDAMEELTGLAGWDLANWDESKLIKMIVHDIFIKKYSNLSNADGKLVGMETRISDVLSSLEIGTEGVRMIGIRGIGGGGKTTLARAVYDQISNHFEGRSFVENEIVHPHVATGVLHLIFYAI